jgi:hypothetical protein
VKLETVAHEVFTLAASLHARFRQDYSLLEVQPDSKLRTKKAGGMLKQFQHLSGLISKRSSLNPGLLIKKVQEIDPGHWFIVTTNLLILCGTTSKDE